MGLSIECHHTLNLSGYLRSSSRDASWILVDSTHMELVVVFVRTVYLRFYLRQTYKRLSTRSMRQWVTMHFKQSIQWITLSIVWNFQQSHRLFILVHLFMIVAHKSRCNSWCLKLTTISFQKIRFVARIIFFSFIYVRAKWKGARSELNSICLVIYHVDLKCIFFCNV